MTARGEAGGRLDVLGGLFGEAGILALSKGTRAATWVEVSPRAGKDGTSFSVQGERDRAPFVIESLSLRALLALPPHEWRAKLGARGAPDWMGNVWGAFGVFARATEWWPETGLHLRAASNVPSERGLASASALCLATLRALEGVAGYHLSPSEAAHWALVVRCEIMGASCDLSQPLACAVGSSDALSPVLYRPDQVREALAIPSGLSVVGCPVGSEAGEAGEDPGRVARIAARMGRVMLERKWGPRAFLCEFAPSHAGDLPADVKAREFRARFGDAALPLDEAGDDGHAFPVRAATTWALEDHFRANLVSTLLGIPDARRAFSLAGELLFQSHAGATRLGLSSPACDGLIAAIRARGLRGGFLGARVSGEGRIKTVVVLLETRVWDELEALRADHSPAGAFVE